MGKIEIYCCHKDWSQIIAFSQVTEWIIRDILDIDFPTSNPQCCTTHLPMLFIGWILYAIMSIIQAAIFRTKSKDYLSPNVKPGLTFGKKGIVKNIHFLLCGSCFWCASQSNNCNTCDMITECPSCNGTEVESLPISHDEVYKFNYDPKRGVTLEFSKLRP
jgi:hypothetical protein